MAELVFLAVFIAVGIAAALGCVADTRDPEYSIGKVIMPGPAGHDESR